MSTPSHLSPAALAEHEETAKLPQPPGLWVLFITEMWERFSYYGMRALFVLFLIASTDQFIEINGNQVENTNPGFGWSDSDAYTLYGLYVFMVYLTSIFGGIVADRLLGTHRSMLLGGWIIALGHICLAGMAFFPHELGARVSLEHGSGALISFLVGCTFIIIGTGFFKPCVSVMVGQLYRDHDARRDSGFTIFYMGINLGAFLSPVAVGLLRSNFGWHYGFGAAAVGMLLGLFFYQMFRSRYLKGIGDPPSDANGKAKSLKLAFFAVIGLVAIPVLPLFLFVFGGLGPIVAGWAWFTGALGTYGMAALIAALVVGSSLLFLFLQPGPERGPLAVILILAFIGNIFFWTAFEQAGSSLNVFAERNTDRTLFGMMEPPGFSAEFYQSVNPLVILLFAPVFSWLWLFLDRRKANPSTPMKFAIGLWLLGLAFIAMIFGSMKAQQGELAGPHYLLITYIVVTWGELCLSPVGLSMVTKLSPKRLQSLMMGLWFFSFALSNLCAGLVARFSTGFIPGEDGTPAQHTFILEGLPGFFLMLVVFPIGAGVVIALLSPWIRKMMHGHDR